jgi:transcriptional regulator with XRE-family HTH domain
MYVSLVSMKAKKRSAREPEPVPTPDRIGKGSTVAREETANNVLNGRPATGMYPMVSRAKLADLTGKDISTISQILRGRNRPKLEDAILIAKVVGVAPEGLLRDWQEQRRKFQQKAEKAARGA